MSDCNSGCVVDVTPMQRLEAFELAINACDRFELMGEDDGKAVVKDNNLSDGIEGRYVTIEASEIIEKPLKDILAVIKDGRPDVIVKGYTRIVGYYSAVSNWNASKIGELRDRANGDYGNPGFVDENAGERMSYIDKH